MNITTIDELKKHIGKILVFEYKTTTQYIAWMEKLYDIKVGKYAQLAHREGNRTSEIDHLCTSGFYTTEIFPRLTVYSYNPLSPYYTDAQTNIRTPTKKEIKLFQNIWRKYRILGNKTVLNKRIQ